MTNGWKCRRSTQSASSYGSDFTRNAKEPKREMKILILLLSDDLLLFLMLGYLISSQLSFSSFMICRWRKESLVFFIEQIHGVWKSPKRSHSRLRAKRATFTFCGQMVLPDRSILIGQKLVENAKSATFWVIFKHCEYLHSADVVAKMEWQKRMMMLHN